MKPQRYLFDKTFQSKRVTMKRLIYVGMILIVLSIDIRAGSAQEYSAATKRLLMKTERLLEESERLNKPLEIPQRLSRQFHIRYLNGEPCVSGFMRVNSDLHESDLLSIGVSVRRKIGDIWSMTIPLHSLGKLKDLKGIERIAVDTPIRKRLDLAGADVKLLHVHQGIGLSQTYAGTDVVVGILDGGFDYTHPAFRDGGGVSRIRAVWDQVDESGTPPAGFSSGSEYTDNETIQNKAHDVAGTEGSHGSHVGGISGGRGADVNGLYTGMAPDADLVLVSLGWGATDIWDGIEYIFNYATRQDKPAVVNMSLGEHIGPHDGTSLTDQVFDRLAGSGKILVGAAGNEADSELHISHHFSGDTIATGPYMFYDEDEDAEFALIEIWGSPNTHMSIAGGLFDTATGTFVAQSAFYASDGSEYEEVSFYNGIDGEAGFIVAAVAKNTDNQSPNIQLELLNTTSLAMVLFITSANSTVHLWHVYEVPFQDLGYPALFQAGDSESTIGEIGGTGKSVISVGAYTTKNSYTDINGQQQQIADYREIGELATFSSRGPTRDGRVKPDITAPGNVVVAPISSFDTETAQMEEIIVALVSNNWPYAAFEGTSMSTPVVTGIVALMLEANPDLTKDQIMDILKQTTREDDDTGDIPDTGSHLWGFGKIDAQAAVMATEEYTGISSNGQNIPRHFSLEDNYPNPFNPTTTIQYRLPRTTAVHISIYNMKGQRITTLVDGEIEAGYHKVIWEARDVSSGVYFYRISADEYSAVGKCLLIK